MKAYHICMLLAPVLSAVGLTGCSEVNLQTSELENALEDAWDAADKPIDNCAADIIRDISGKPSLLGEDYQADWNSTFDQFTLTYPINDASRLAMTLFLGEFGDGFNQLESLGRELMDEDGVRRTINGKFNDQWAALFLSLIVVDGSFVYEIETDSWGDNSFDFDSKDLYNMLKEKEYFSDSDVGAGAGMTAGQPSGQPSGSGSLMDLAYDKESIRSGKASLNLLHIGNNFDRVLNETGSTHQLLSAAGVISNHDVFVDCWLTEDGELHGRYRNENGTKLDLNGYIRPNGDLYIQLGHGSEKSEWRLHPVGDEPESTYRYEGTWGKSNKPSYLVFRKK